MVPGATHVVEKGVELLASGREQLDARRRHDGRAARAPAQGRELAGRGVRERSLCLGRELPAALVDRREDVGRLGLDLAQDPLPQGRLPPVVAADEEVEDDADEGQQGHDQQPGDDRGRVAVVGEQRDDDAEGGHREHGDKSDLEARKGDRDRHQSPLMNESWTSSRAAVELDGFHLLTKSASPSPRSLKMSSRPAVTEATSSSSR